MKIRALSLILATFSFVFILNACAEASNTNNNYSVPPAASQIQHPPQVITFGDYISWGSVSGATRYEIYCNDDLIATTDKTNYIMSELDNDVSLYVCSTNGTIKSEKSNVVYVSKNKNFSSSEIMDLRGQSTYNAVISSNIRKIIIGADNHESFSLNAQIADRTSDLIFELKNITVNGTLSTQSGTYTRTDNNYSVIFNIQGDCSFIGDNGSHGFDFSDSHYDNKGLDAGQGQHGTSALILPSIVICGNGNFTVKGGNGGNGGKGSATTQWEAEAAPGKGANGGDGAGAIFTSYFVLRLEAGKTFTVIDGKGGAKGTPGNNGSIISGPAVSLMWSDVYNIGKVGADGKSILRTRTILSGNIKYGG